MSYTFDEFFQKLENIENQVRLIGSEIVKLSPVKESEELLTEAEAASFLKVARQTLKTWRDDGKITFIRAGRHIRYQKSDLIKRPKTAKNAK